MRRYGGARFCWRWVCSTVCAFGPGATTDEFAKTIRGNRFAKAFFAVSLFPNHFFPNRFFRIKEQLRDDSTKNHDLWNRGGQPRIFSGSFGQDWPRRDDCGGGVGGRKGA